jgi:hypothetical protein
MKDQIISGAGVALTVGLLALLLAGANRATPRQTGKEDSSQTVPAAVQTRARALAAARSAETPEPGPGKVVVGKVNRQVLGKVIKIEEGNAGAKRVTLTVGKADGMDLSKRVTCTPEPTRRWRGQAVEVTETNTLIEVRPQPGWDGEPQLGDSVRVAVSYVLTGHPGPAVGGLELTLMMDVSGMPCYVDKDGKPVWIRPDQPLPEGAVEKEFKNQYLSAQIKNVSDKPIVVGVSPSGTMVYGTQDAPFKVYAKDAEGNLLPPLKTPDGLGAMGLKPTETPPLSVTILKPGQVLTERFLRWVSSTQGAKGKLTVWAEFDQPTRDEPLPGVKLWSGLLKSNEAEWDAQSWYFQQQPVVRGPAVPKDR